ncbi:MAG: HlyD family efflux transporter periplasmic adaptor subunit [Rhodobacteraceae bacterium]|nr:HlyD family efflux transporter periplasmic adaptor subunit [Paracoccaceae bacterium]
MKTIRLTAAQAMVKWLAAQKTPAGDSFIAGCWAIFGHGNVAGLGEALYHVQDVLPTYRGHNEQTMAHTAIAYAKQNRRDRAMMVTSSIGPGATNMVTACALAYVNRLPVLFVPGDVFAHRGPDPVLQQPENFADGTVTATDTFRPVSRYFDRITRPEQLLTALPRALRTMTDPADCGPAVLAFCQDVQAEAYDWPVAFFDEKVWRRREPQPDPVEVAAVAALLRDAKHPVIVAGGGVLYGRAEAALAGAEKELERLEIKASFAGLLESDTAELGSLLQPGGLCATVIQLDPIKLVGYAPEAQVGRIEVGALAGARLSDGRELRGRVTFLSRRADDTTRTFRLEIEVPNADLSVRDGQTAELLIASDGAKAHLLPQSTLTLNDDGVLGVRLVGDGNLTVFAPVQLLRDTVQGVWVTGLPDAADVITVGQEYVVEGVEVAPSFKEPM